MNDTMHLWCEATMRHIGLLACFLWLDHGVAQAAELRGSLATHDVRVSFVAGVDAPRLISLRATAGPEWRNREAETLPVDRPHHS